MDKKLTKEENDIVEAETIKLKMKTPEERRAFIQGRITGIKTVLHLIRGELVHNDRKFSVYRCENDEVVCYMTHTYYTDGISCKFKEQEQ